MSLSVPQIAARQEAIEQSLQGVAREQERLDKAVVDTELAFITARARAALTVAATADGVKLLAQERQDRILLACQDEWQAFEIAKVTADACRNKTKQLNNELMSLASRAKAALASDSAHANYGGY